MKNSNNKHRFIIFIGFGLVLTFLIIAFEYLRRSKIPVLNPKGPIALKEYHLIIFALLLSLVVVIPVYALAIGFAWKYRESNQSAKYSPELSGNKFAETIWWLIPSVLISILAVVAWNSSHELDPFKPINSSVPPMIIQVVALDWKWLFIYPAQNIATVNYMQFPTQTPINFEITSDAPMNSFWIPQLGGQIYAMPGMSTQLNLLASVNGSYIGSSANISGEGFAGMSFTVKSTSEKSFNIWLKIVKQSNKLLSLAAYNKLSQPSQYNKPTFYSSTYDNLYNTIIDKYMIPSNNFVNPANTKTYSTTITQEMGMQ